MYNGVILDKDTLRGMIIMKKLIAIFSLTLLLGTTALTAQDFSDSAFDSNKNWELHAGYGYISANTFAMLVGTALGAVLTAPIADKVDYRYDDYGIINVGANYYFNDHIYAGLNSTFQYMTIFGDSNILFGTLMAEFGVQYGWSRIKFYHAVDAGIGVAISDKASPYFACNLTWLGIKFRPTEHLWIYAESNLGQKGFLQAGIRVKL